MKVRVNRSADLDNFHKISFQIKQRKAMVDKIIFEKDKLQEWLKKIEDAQKQKKAELSKNNKLFYQATLMNIIKI